jgi:single-strand DNA-binding protein
MIQINSVTVAGFLVRDPEARTVGDKTVAKFCIAVNRRYRSKEGEQKEEVCFLDVECWDRMAELVIKHLIKGSLVVVLGSLKQERWEDKDGKNRNRILVRSDSVQFVSGTKTEDYHPVADDPPRAPRVPTPATNDDDEPPF